MPNKSNASIINKTFNNFRVDAISSKRDNQGKRLYECTCLRCGKTFYKNRNDIVSGKVKDCGKHKKYNNLCGHKYGRLTALYPLEERKRGCVVWHCRCKCGNEIDVNSQYLRNGNTKSCGCLHIDKVKDLYCHQTAPCKLNGEKIRNTNTSGCTGVSFDKSRNKWAAEIMFKKKKYHLGRYTKKEDAIAARKKAEGKIFGEFLEWYSNHQQNC